MMSKLSAVDTSNLNMPGSRSSVLCGEVEIPPPPQLPPPPRPSNMAIIPPNLDKEQVKNIQKNVKATLEKSKTSIEKTKTEVEKSVGSVPAIPKRPAPTVIKPSSKPSLQQKAEDKVKKAAVAYATKAVIAGVKEELGMSKSAPSRPAPPPPATKKNDVSPPRSPTRHAPKTPSKYNSMERKAPPPSRPKVTRSATLPSNTEKSAPSRPQTLPLVTEFKHESLPSPRKSLRPTILTAAGALPIKLRKTESLKHETRSPSSPLKDNTSFANNCNSPVGSNPETKAKKPPPIKTKPVIARKPSVDMLPPPQIKKISSPESEKIDFSKIIQLPDTMKQEVNGKTKGRPKSAYFCADQSPEEHSTRSRSPSPKVDQPKKPPRLTPAKTNLKKSKSLVVRRRHVSPPSSPPPPPKSPHNRTASFSTSPTRSSFDDDIRSRHLRRSKSNVGSTDHGDVNKDGQLRSASPKAKPARPKAGPYMVKSDNEQDNNVPQVEDDNVDAVQQCVMTDIVDINPTDDMKPLKPSRPAPPVRNTSIPTPTEEEKESSFMSNLKAKLEVSRPHALAISNHQAITDKELSFMIGDIIFLLKRINNDYYFGKIEDKSGIVPVKSIEVFIDIDEIDADNEIPCSEDDEPSNDESMLEMEDPHAIVVHRYIASNDNELTLNPGDSVHLECECDNDMLKGSCNGQSGIFPASFVAIVVPLSKRNKSNQPKENIPPKLTISIKDDITGPHCFTTFAFDSNIDDDLSFPKGEIIKLLEKVNDEWFKGEYNGMVGMFPRAYVDIVEDIPEDVVKQTQEAIVLCHAKAMYDFQGAHPNELTFIAGDIISITRIINDDWLEGEVADRTGMFPVSFVQKISKENEISHEGDDLENLSNSDDMSPKAKAIHDFDAIQDEELSFPAGATIYLTKTLDSDWYEGEYNGKVGIFPAKFIEIITPLPDFL